MDITGMRKPYNEQDVLFLESGIKQKEPISLFDEWFQTVKNDPKTFEANAMCLATSTKDGKPSARMVLLKGYGKDGFRFFTHYNSRKGRELEENPVAAVNFYWDHYSRVVRIEGSVEKLPISIADDYFSKRPTVYYLDTISAKIVALARKEKPKKIKNRLWKLKSCRLTENYSKSGKIVFTALKTTKKESFFSRERYDFRTNSVQIVHCGGPYKSQIGVLCTYPSKPIEGRHILEESEKQLTSKYSEGEVPRPPLWGGYILKPDSIEFWQGQTNRIHDRIRFRKPQANEPDGKLTHQGEDGWIYERLAP